MAAVIKSFNVRTITPVQQVTGVQEQVINDSPIVRGPSCPTGSRLLWENMAHEVDTRIAGIAPSPATRDVWLTRGNDIGGWQRNSNVWTNRGQTPLDLTGISPWNSDSNFQKAGTLISPRHIAMADHHAIPINATIIFVDNANNIVTRTVVNTRTVGVTTTTSDIRIGVLNADVPSTITHYPILNKYDLLGTPQERSTYIKWNSHRVPVLMLNQRDEAIVSDTSQMDPYANFIARTLPTNNQRYIFWGPLGWGDSGDATLAVINGRMALLGTHYLQVWDSNHIYYHDLVDEQGINDILEAVEILSPGYVLPTFNLDCLERNIAPEFSRNSYNFTLDQSYNAGTVVGRVPATDSNSSNDSLIYQLTGTTAGQFSISLNGDITILQPGLLDSVSSITFTAQVKDDWFSFMSDSAPITITRSNSGNPITRPAGNVEEFNNPQIDTTPPTFDRTLYWFTINEGLPSGSVVGQVTATDTQDSTLTYSILNGNSSGLFSINANTGQIRIANPSNPNYRAPYIFILNIRASDSSNNHGSSVALIQITNTCPTCLARAVNAVEQTIIEDGGGGGGGGGSGGGGGGSGGGGPSSNHPSIPGLPPPQGPGASVQQQIAYLQEVVRILILRLQTQMGQSGLTFPNNTTSISTCGNMSTGSTGPCVQTLQRYLNSHGFVVTAYGPGSPVFESTYFGPATTQAVIRFQTAFGIYPSSGLFGPITRAQMTAQP